MPKPDLLKLWALNYRQLTSVIVEVAPALRELGLECKELFLLAEVDAHPHPAELADALLIPRPSITMYVKRLESVGLVKREIDSEDLRRHRLTLTAAGRKALTRGQALLGEAFGRRMSRLTAAQQSELKEMLEKLA